MTGKIRLQLRPSSDCTHVSYGVAIPIRRLVYDGLRMFMLHMLSYVVVWSWIYPSHRAWFRMGTTLVLPVRNWIIGSCCVVINTYNTPGLTETIVLVTQSSIVTYIYIYIYIYILYNTCTVYTDATWYNWIYLITFNKPHRYTISIYTKIR